MTYLAGSVQSLVADRNTWHSRADSAWGATRVWSNGTSFEAQAWTGGAYGNGQLWSDAAHNDPNVWTNRYNTGYSDGNAAGYTAGYNQATIDKQPPASVVYLQASGGITGSSNQYNFAAQLQPDRAGYWVALGFMRGAPEFTGVQLRVNGAIVAATDTPGWQGGFSAGASQPPGGAFGSVNSGQPKAGCYWAGLLATSDVVSVYGKESKNSGNQGTTCWVMLYFVPVQGYPH